MTDKLSEKQIALLRQLRSEMPDSVKSHTIKWPSYIKVPGETKSDDAIVRFHLDSLTVVSNMQTDASSFEGWAVVVKAWLENEKDIQVELSWDSPETFDLRCRKQKNQYRHYQRYLYRVIRFREMFNWFVVSAESEHMLNESQVLLRDGQSRQGPFYLNSGNQEIRDTDPICDKAFKDLSEDCVEKLFAGNYESLMQCAFGRSGQKLMRQFPVGVFKGRVTNSWDNFDSEMPIFTGGKSAIDLWALDKGRAAIFELKKPSGNKKVGVISELLFYANIVRDVQLGILSYGSPETFEKQLQSTDGVDSYFLLGEGNIHPLLHSKSVTDCLNRGAGNRLISFDIIYYDNALACRKENWQQASSTLPYL